jgi:hypothetical protein
LLILFIVIRMIKFYGSFPNFQEDSNILKYALFKYNMNFFWIFKLSIIASPKMWVGSTKTMMYNNCTFMDYYSAFSLLEAYFNPKGFLALSIHYKYSLGWSNFRLILDTRFLREVSGVMKRVCEFLWNFWALAGFLEKPWYMYDFPLIYANTYACIGTKIAT